MAKKKTYDDDDGRVIANMNVDGMPWSMSDVLSRRKKSDEKLQSSSDFSDVDTREIIKGTVKAATLFLTASKLTTSSLAICLVQTAKQQTHILFMTL